MSALGVDAQVLGNHEFDRGAQNVATQYPALGELPAPRRELQVRADHAGHPELRPHRHGRARRSPSSTSGGLKVARHRHGEPLEPHVDLRSAEQPRHHAAQHRRGRAVLHRPAPPVRRPRRHRHAPRARGRPAHGPRHDRASTSSSAATTTSSSTRRRRSATARRTRTTRASSGRSTRTRTIRRRRRRSRPTAADRDPANHPFAIKRPCKPRTRDHRALGRVREVRRPARSRRSPTTRRAHRRRATRRDYDPVNGFEVQSSRYNAFPIDATVPEDPVIVDMLQPYQRGLDLAADLDILVGYSPDGSRRFATTRRRLAARQPGRQRDLAAPRHPDRLLAHELDRHPHRSQPGPDHRRADVQHLPVRQLDHEDAALRRSRCRSSSTSPRAAPPVAAAPRRSRSPARACASTARAATASTIACQTDVDCMRRRPRRLRPDDQVRRELQRRTTTARRASAARATGRARSASSTRAPSRSTSARPARTLHGATTSAATIRRRRPLPGSATKTERQGTTGPLPLGDQADEPLRARDEQLPRRRRLGLPRPPAKHDAVRHEDPAARRAHRLPARGQAVRLRPGEQPTPDGLKACSADADCGDPTLVCSCPGHVAESGTTPSSRASRKARARRRWPLRAQDCRDEVAAFPREALRRRAGPEPRCQVAVGACQLAGEECKILACIDTTIGSLYRQPRGDGRPMKTASPSRRLLTVAASPARPLLSVARAATASASRADATRLAVELDASRPKVVGRASKPLALVDRRPATVPDHRARPRRNGTLDTSSTATSASRRSPARSSRSTGPDADGRNLKLIERRVARVRREGHERVRHDVHPRGRPRLRPGRSALATRRRSARTESTTTATARIDFPADEGCAFANDDTEDGGTLRARRERADLLRAAAHRRRARRQVRPGAATCSGSARRPIRGADLHRHRLPRETTAARGFDFDMVVTRISSDGFYVTDIEATRAAVQQRLLVQLQRAAAHARRAIA